MHENLRARLETPEAKRDRVRGLMVAFQGESNYWTHLMLSLLQAPWWRPLYRRRIVRAIQDSAKQQQVILERLREASEAASGG